MSESVVLRSQTRRGLERRGSQGRLIVPPHRRCLDRQMSLRAVAASKCRRQVWRRSSELGAEPFEHDGMELGSLRRARVLQGNRRVFCWSEQRTMSELQSLLLVELHRRIKAERFGQEWPLLEGGPCPINKAAREKQVASRERQHQIVSYITSIQTRAEIVRMLPASRQP